MLQINLLSLLQKRCQQKLQNLKTYFCKSRIIFLETSEGRGIIGILTDKVILKM